MKKLPLPAKDAEDDKVVTSVCKKKGWSTQEADWLAAYSAYRAAKGDPWIVSVTTLTPDIAKDQRALYDTRKSSGPLRRMRNQRGLLACPVCGSPTTGHLDHYLPREPFAEFSLMRLNLVPACQHCNSSSKGSTYRGGTGERFIHPYFDDFADQALWFVEIGPPLRAASFTPKPLPGFDPATEKIIQFHLEHVLGEQFQIFASNQWSVLGRLIAKGVQADHVFTMSDVTARLGGELERSVVTCGLNGWNTALLRGVLRSPAAILLVMTEAQASLA